MNPNLQEDPDLLSSYGFELPSRLIAQSPSPQRDAARLLLVRRNPEKGLPRFEDLRVSDLPDWLRENPDFSKMLWLRNISKVIPARFYVHRQKRDQSGGYSRHEVVYLESSGQSAQQAKVILRASARFRYPETVVLENNPEIQLTVLSADTLELDLSKYSSWLELLKTYGEMPLPPYINVRDAKRDEERYQSIWASNEHQGSVAAPTASLHFTQKLLDALSSVGVHFADLSLDVGLGTFEPVRVDRLSLHRMHSERLAVDLLNLEKIKHSKEGIFCVGTTALRGLESLSDEDFASKGVLKRTELFIKPGFNFRSTKALWTNFHLPESTLFVLLSSFAGSTQLAKEAYGYAVSKNYRFFSYGDASLWI